MNEPSNSASNNPYQDSEFDNPFNTKPPAVREPHTSPDGVAHKAALRPDQFVALKLLSVRDLGERQAEYQFFLPKPTDHTGCLPGQYVQAKVTGSDGKPCQRYFSPVSGTSEYGRLTLVMKYESQGQISQQFKLLKPGTVRRRHFTLSYSLFFFPASLFWRRHHHHKQQRRRQRQRVTMAAKTKRESSVWLETP